MNRKKIIAANWKMNVLQSDIKSLVTAITKSKFKSDRVDVILAAPFVYLSLLRDLVKGSSIQIASQNVSSELNGPYTGEISVQMLADNSINFCIVGHSERRRYFNENDTLIGLKANRLIDSQITPIICIGETFEERESEKTEVVLESQLSLIFKEISNVKQDKIILAYEPVWAIGTGKTASPEQAAKSHAFIRNWLSTNFNDNFAQSVRILYGGSMNAKNCRELLKNDDIDGGLIGSAALDPQQLSELIAVGQE